MYLYIVSSRLLNVRLGEAHVRKTLVLRDRGITLSDVVREAIDARFAALEPSPRGDLRAMVKSVLARHPDPVLPPRDYDVHDRRAAQLAIRRKLRS